MGPGGYSQGYDNDVPHFDQRGHYQTHSGIERTRHKARRKTTIRVEEAEESARGSSVAFGFVMLSGVLGIILAVPVIIGNFQSGQQRRQKEGKS